MRAEHSHVWTLLNSTLAPQVSQERPLVSDSLEYLSWQETLRAKRRQTLSYRTCPVPTISYFDEVSSASAKGPRQCNFWVLMPISAPKPNSVPSVKRVEAFQYTAAESTPRKNLRAFASSCVTMESE